MDSQIQNYINQSRASGQTDEQIKTALLKSGWSQAQVNDAFGVPNPQGSTIPSMAQSQSASNNKLMAIISYFGILWIIPLLTDAKNDSFVKFHIKQGIILTISFFVVWVVGGMIPILGWMAIPILNLILFVIFIMGIISHGF